MPTDRQLNEFREFIIKYYDDKILLKIYNNAVFFNKKLHSRLINKIGNIL